MCIAKASFWQYFLSTFAIGGGLYLFRHKILLCHPTWHYVALIYTSSEVGETLRFEGKQNKLFPEGRNIVFAI
jgi:hypothetical protein